LKEFEHDFEILEKNLKNIIEECR